MPTFTGTQKAAGPNLEDGYYECVITEATEVEGNFGPQVEVRFKVVPGEEGEGEEFINWYSIYTNKAGDVQPVRVGTMLGDLFSAALFSGEPYPEGTDLDTDELPRKRVRVNFGEYTVKKTGMKKRGVIAVKASKRKAAAAVKAATASVRARLVDEDADDDLADA
jgi:hypothetical protein